MLRADRGGGVTGRHGATGIRGSGEARPPSPVQSAGNRFERRGGPIVRACTSGARIMQVPAGAASPGSPLRAGQHRFFGHGPGLPGGTIRASLPEAGGCRCWNSVGRLDARARGEDDPGLREVLVLGRRTTAIRSTRPTRDDAIDMFKFYDSTSPSWTGACRRGGDLTSWLGPQTRQAHGDPDADRPRRPAGQDPPASTRARTITWSAVRPWGAAGADPSGCRRRPRGVDAPVIARGTLALDPIPPRSHGGGTPAGPDVHRIQHPRLLMRRGPAVVDRRRSPSMPGRD